MRVEKLSSNSTEYLSTYYNIVNTMEKAMKEAPITDSISQNFITAMIPHHEGAIAMSKNILNYTTSTDIEELANTIITGQSIEIKKMQEMLPNCNGENSPESITLYERKYNVIFSNMINKMKDPTISNNLDIAFLEEMMPHHMGAILMGKNVLNYNICKELEELVKNLVKVQSEQYEYMQKLLKSLKQSCK